jgi:hypothetical protein
MRLGKGAGTSAALSEKSASGRFTRKEGIFELNLGTPLFMRRALIESELESSISFNGSVLLISGMLYRPYLHPLSR